MTAAIPSRALSFGCQHLNTVQCRLFISYILFCAYFLLCTVSGVNFLVIHYFVCFDSYIVRFLCGKSLDRFCFFGSGNGNGLFAFEVCFLSVLDHVSVCSFYALPVDFHRLLNTFDSFYFHFLSCKFCLSQLALQTFLHCLHFF